VSFLSRVLEVALIAAVLVTTAPFGDVAAEAEAPEQSGCLSYKAEENRFLNNINASRRAGSLEPLTLDRELTRVARKHTFEMGEESRLHHTSTTDLRRRVTNWRLLGENVGVDGTVESMHLAFMESPGHRANVMHERFERVGVGTREIDGRLWVTVVFEGGTDPGTRLAMRNC